MSGEQIHLQVPPELFGVNSWIPQTTRQWIPDCWSGDRKFTGHVGATANSRNWQLMTATEKGWMTIMTINQSINQYIYNAPWCRGACYSADYAEAKRNVLSRVLNVSTDGAVRQFRVSEFQRLGAATEPKPVSNALQFIVLLLVVVLLPNNHRHSYWPDRPPHQCQSALEGYGTRRDNILWTWNDLACCLYSTIHHSIACKMSNLDEYKHIHFNSHFPTFNLIMLQTVLLHSILLSVDCCRQWDVFPSIPVVLNFFAIFQAMGHYTTEIIILLKSNIIIINALLIASNEPVLGDSVGYTTE